MAIPSHVYNSKFWKPDNRCFFSADSKLFWKLHGTLGFGYNYRGRTVYSHQSLQSDTSYSQEMRYEGYLSIIPRFFNWIYTTLVNITLIATPSVILQLCLSYLEKSNRYWKFMEYNLDIILPHYLSKFLISNKWIHLNKKWCFYWLHFLEGFFFIKLALLLQFFYVWNGFWKKNGTQSQKQGT